jgi:very-short-patch-repair endonuclease
MASTRPPSRIDRTESRDSRDFPSSRFEDAANWTETRDLQLIARAARTGGVVTTSDLRTCGFSRDTTRAAVRRGLLTRWGRNVYLVGPITDEMTEARAAMLAIPHGTLGFDVAAQLAQFRPIAKPPLDVIVDPDRHGERKGVKIHRLELGRQDVTRMQGLPVTTPAVTLVHLARTLPALPYERAVQEAYAKRLTDDRRLEQALDRHRGGRGTARVRRMLELGVDDLRSRAERSLRRWVHQSGLPLPIFNAEVGPWRVDALWNEKSLAVEINGHAAHSSPWAHDRDHRKEQYLIARGLTTRRFTALQAIDEPALVIAGVAAALATQKR